MQGVMERTFGILEHLARHTQGCTLGTIAHDLGLPRSAAHRLLTDLCLSGYVRQLHGHGDYVLTTKLISLGLHHLSNSGAIDAAQPLLDRLAISSGELVRLGVVDGETLTWVAKSQGARQGVRYDPEMGGVAQLRCTASGHAWLLTLSDEQALDLVRRQDTGQKHAGGPNAPTSEQGLLQCLHQARQRGYSLTLEIYNPGMGAMAAPVRRPGGQALGIISIAGPMSRLDEARMLALGPELLAAAAELAAASGESLLLGRSAAVGGPP
ncbi:IclR family transcriptional regulator [Sphaerotilus hippei]|uniref:IclR family transcriptional regulator n=1 Tax=Sphaerotilus hippei TaxID=744406 RepID=A0A318GZ60_9BURK|nr:IclR family transcriptional regulator [Sphaerotilus hippei]PXW94032.1 IclR family transcriptional regulator [Sphaerotilus hippei]